MHNMLPSAPNPDEVISTVSYAPTRLGHLTHVVACSGLGYDFPGDFGEGVQPRRLYVAPESSSFKLQASSPAAWTRCSSRWCQFNGRQLGTRLGLPCS
jgi:hypothetical protein